MNTTTHKICCHCHRELSLDNYWISRKEKDGLQQKCKDCIRGYGKAKCEKEYALGIRKRGKPPLSDELKKKIIELYLTGEYSCVEVGKQIGYSKVAVRNLLIKNNIKIIPSTETNRKYKFKDEHFFDTIDTEAKAYFMGLLWADGCNYIKISKNKNAHQIVISLQERDKYILEKFCEYIYEDSSILRYVKATKYKNINKNPQWTFRIPSKHISTTLLNHGMEPRKSFTCEWPKNLPTHLEKHFIRGYYDGDGGISFNSNSKNYIVGMISSVPFIATMKDRIYKLTGLDLSLKVEDKKYSKPMSILKIHGNNKCEKFLSWLYSDSSIFLKRKKERYNQLKSLIGRNAL